MKTPTYSWLSLICMIVIVFMHAGPVSAESQSKKIQPQANDHSSLNESPSHNQLNSKHLNPKPLNPKPLNSKQLYLKPLNSKQLTTPGIPSFKSTKATASSQLNFLSTSCAGKGALIGGIITFSIGFGLLVGWAGVAAFTEEDFITTGREWGYALLSWALLTSFGALIGMMVGALFCSRGSSYYPKCPQVFRNSSKRGRFRFTSKHTRS